MIDPMARIRGVLPHAAALVLSAIVAVGCGGSTEETDTAVGIGPGAGRVGDVSPGEEVPTEPVVGTGGSVVEPPEAPGAAPTIGTGDTAAVGTTPPAEAGESP